jgi:hypothetical protein
LGYFKHQDDGDIHSIMGELYRESRYKSVWLKAGAGVGFSIPNPALGKADNGISHSLGVGAEYPIAPNVTIGATVKGFFFKTNRSWITWDIQSEQLQTGPTEWQEVQTVTPIYHSDSQSFNKLLIGLSVRFYF